MKLGIYRLGIAAACFSFVSSASALAQTVTAPIADPSVAAAAPIAVAAPNPARAGATRFLAQATFGARPADVDHLLQVGYAGWIDQQIASPLTFSYPRLALNKRCGMQRACIDSIHDVFWVGAVEDANQLRQRVTFALSQIFVISVRDANSPEV